MRNIFKFSIFFVFLIFFFGCNKDFLELQPKNILLESQVWNDEVMITDLLANYYDNLPVHSQINNGERYFAELDEAVAVNSLESNMDINDNNIISYPYNRWTLWNYDMIRNINLALDGLDKYSTKLTPDKVIQFKAEFRFLRVYNYFEMVKRMGGVPLITNQLIYDYSGDPSYLAKPRNKEADVYDFISNECDEIKNLIGNNGSQTRANKYTVLALKSRAMLYAASSCKYNSQMPVPISLPGGEVGIAGSRANEYYTKALSAANEIITSGNYKLYTSNPNLGENFYDAIVKKGNNTEVIMAMDFNVGKKHNFSYHQICRTMREDNLSSSGISPSLNLVESYEYLDGTNGTLKGVGTGSNTAPGQSNWIYYDRPEDIFANKDARLFGTVIYPGTSFKGVAAQIQSGVYVWNETSKKYDRVESSVLGSLYSDGKTLTGLGGPLRSASEVSNTGFYLRKYVDPQTMSSARGVASQVWWIRFRYAEVLLNAAEAALELGLTSNALVFVNAVRERAGFGANSLNVTTLNLAKIQNERRVELAFEDHRLWDVMRWRIAHVIWNGSASNPDANLYSLFCYRVIRPGHANDGKYVFDKFVAPNFKSPRFFQLGNYHSEISQKVLDNNKLIVKNPFH